MASRKKAKTASAADAVEEQLARYRSMRDFNVTEEPSGKAAASSIAEGLPFVIQKHAATRLHYDFRLGWRGVLKSWAVAKGPSYFTGDKRLAVEVEDHPIEYGGFEGTIPKGQYGGGTVMVWDQGTWEPQGDAGAMLEKGNLKMVLHGAKLQGKWALVRMGGRAAREAKPNWLLIKEHDEYERSATDEPVTEEQPDSAITGRTMDAIAAAGDHVWNSKEPQKRADHGRDRELRARLAARKAGATQSSDTPAVTHVPASAEEEPLPSFIAPQLAGETSRAPEGEEWVHEIKLDGYRIQARIQAGGGSQPKVTLFTRTGLDWTARMKELASELATLRVESAVLDGEVVVLDEAGLSSFAELQTAFQEHKRKRLTYFAFDLLHLNRHNLRGLELLQRKELLSQILVSHSGDSVRFGDHVTGNGNEVFREACRLGAEGVVSKLTSATYESGRSKAWLKIKCGRQQEFVIGGFTLPSNGSVGVGALLLGYYEGGKLIYAGRTGTGFTQKTHRLLRKQLDALRTTTMAYADVPREARAGAIWVKPELVAEVAFATWTADKLVRQAAFKGLREDKPAKEVVRETGLPDGDAGPAPEKPTRPQSRVPQAAKKGGSAMPLPVKLSHADKVLDAASGLSKQALAEYYLAIAPHILPHIEDRPLSIIRCPDGTAGQCFFQRHLNKSLPRGTEGIPIKDKKSDEVETYITLSTVEALVGLAQMNVLELHPWGCRNEDIEHPDRLIFDLDPDEAIDWRTLADSALEVKKRLQTAGLKSFLKTTGGKGLHVVAPIAPEHAWLDVKDFAHQFVLEMEKENSKLFLTKMSKSARRGRIYLDYLRNERGATAVAPFSPRARSGMAVSLPLAWSELESERPQFRVADFAEWEARLRQDPWKDLAKTRQSLKV